jgi:DNA-binding NarL/FixJ family response regulator
LALAKSAEIDTLVYRALVAFRALEMQGWLQRALALQEQLAASRAPASATTPTYPDGLTAREVEVLSLLAGGLTNKEIAERLVLSIPTVARHIANIYTKIDARGRADATAYALRHGLVPLRGPVELPPRE